MGKNERLEMLLNELGDSTPRHVGGVSGGYTTEGQWATQQIAYYGLDAVLPLAARLRLAYTIENGDISVLNHFGFRDPTVAKEWAIGIRSRIRYALMEIPEAVEHLRKNLSNKDSTIRSMSALAIGFLLDKEFSKIGSMEVKTLRSLKASKAIESLITVICDSNEEVRKEALLALKKIRGRSFLIGNGNFEKWHKWWMKKYNK
jgi:hypothetical protein